MKQSLHRIIPIILLVLLAAACSRDEETPGTAESHALQLERGVTGEALFIERCRDCHRVHEKGGVVGPDLSTIGIIKSRAYLEQAIREPSELFPGTVMPPSDSFSVQQVNSLVDYLSTLQ